MGVGVAFVSEVTGSVGAGVDFFFGKSQPKGPRFFGLGVASPVLSEFAAVLDVVVALLAVEFAASLGPLFKSDCFTVVSVFFSVEDSAALSVGETSWA